MNFSISDTIPRVALITGGGHGTGLAIGRALANAGFAVAMQCDPGGSPRDLPSGIVALPADLADEEQTAALPGRAAAALGAIGVLVNAASLAARDTWDQAPRAIWDAHMQTNLRAPFVLIQHFAKALPEACEGVAINLLGGGTRQDYLSYSLTKAALWTLTQTMALALAPRIRVNGIAGGPSGGADEIAHAALAILAFRSMTGQMIDPNGVPPPGA
ncbi:MAG: SDR family NAD(P)-dependent oxidoreductase [Acetobacteraceae bacterium]|nr:SDR family NAD(P)-dependent oxidoreductase [Acetobacteraceae bacterium]